MSIFSQINLGEVIEAIMDYHEVVPNKNFQEILAKATEIDKKVADTNRDKGILAQVIRFPDPRPCLHEASDSLLASEEAAAEYWYQEQIKAAELQRKNALKAAKTGHKNRAQTINSLP